MRKYKVTLQGKNLLLDKDRVGKYGVLVVRFVEAIDEVLAGHTALENFRCESKWEDLHGQLLNAPDDPPIFKALEITEIESIDRSAKPIGLIFYPEDPSDDAQSNL